VICLEKLVAGENPAPGSQDEGAPGCEASPGESLRLEHRALIEPLLRDLDLPLSEYCFANLFLFRQTHRYSLSLDPLPHILGVTYDGVRHCMPLVSLNRANAECLLRYATCLYPLPEELAQRAQQEWSLEARWNEDDSDYVFEAGRLAALEGNALRSKRSQAAAFVGATHPTVLSLLPRNIGAAVEVLDRWAAQVRRPAAATDYAACREALACFAALGLHGLQIVDSEGVARGFLIAQYLGQGGAAIHFAKGDRNYPGVYPYMFSQYAARTSASWLNFEQDLGKPGLRQAKRALDPQRLSRKYRLWRSA
jgi:hypothetical protein